MTAESLKHFIQLPPEPSYMRPRRKYTPALIFFFVILALLGVTLLSLTIYNSVRAKNLKEDVDQLHKLVDTLQKRLGLDLFHDLTEFEQDYKKDRGGDFLDDDDEFLDDGSIDDYDEETDKIKDDFPKDSKTATKNDGILDDEDFDGGDYDLEQGSASYEYDDGYGDLEYSDYLSKKEKKRKTRSIPTSRSGIPVYQESYALYRKNQSKEDEVLNSLLLRRRKVKPTIKYDWDKPSQPLPLSKDSHYAESRAQPESFVRAPPHLRPIPEQLRDMHHSREYAYRARFDPSYPIARPGRVMYVKGPMSQNIRHAPSYPGQVVLTDTRRRNIRPMHRSMENKQRQGISRPRTIAVHYVGDTSQYTPGRHEHYEGNGRLRHLGGTYADWVADTWVGNLNMERFFRMENGVVTVRENGLYYVYAQIFYHDDHDVNGFVVERNRQQFLQCTTMTHTTHRVTKSNSCFTSGVTFLKNGDSISLSDLGSHRYTILEPAKSFFGLVKIADARNSHPALSVSNPVQNDMSPN